VGKRGALVRRKGERSKKRLELVIADTAGEFYGTEIVGWVFQEIKIL